MMPTTQALQKTKQIIVINEARKPSTETVLAQMAQASAGAFVEAEQDAREIWMMTGRPRMLLKALGEDDFQDFLAKAEQRKLPICRVMNAEAIDSSTDGFTCLGIGPASDEQIDELAKVLDFYNWVRQNAFNASSLFPSNVAAV